MKEFTRNLEETIQEEHSNITGMLISEKGETTYEQYFNGTGSDSALHIASVTKSITSILIGIAIDQGYIESVESKVIDFFPEYTLKRGEKTLPTICIKDLLTMTAPYKYRSEPYSKVFRTEDWTKATLDLLGGRSPVGTFKYSTVGMHILTGIVSKASGMTVVDFADKYLFKPLGIEKPEDVVISGRESYMDFVKSVGSNRWVRDEKGVHTGGWGLCLKTEDLLKIGQLYLKKGQYNGKRIISEEWITESISVYSHMGDKPYGYLWWLVEEAGMKGYAALGDGGNGVVIIPEREMVVAILASFYPRANDRIQLIHDYLESKQA